MFCRELLLSGCLVTSVFAFLALAGRLWNALTCPGSFALKLLLGTVFMAGSGIGMLWIFFQEKNTV